MGEIKWTREQLLAIEERGSDLLVSAAAGSGKTAVLTERIIRDLTDEEKPVDVTDFLIVTFTVMATNELREKLNKAIKKASLEKHASKNLKRQLLNLPNAKILTIDSFCKFIVTECAKALQLPTDFKIGEENELNQLTLEVLSDTLDDYFDGYEAQKIADISFLPEKFNGGFLKLVEAFSSQKTFTALNETILDIYSKLLSVPEPNLRTREYLSEYEKMLRGHYEINDGKSFFDSKLGQFIILEIRESLNTAIKYLEQAESLLIGHESMSEKYAPCIQDDLAQIKNALSFKDAELVKEIAKIKFMTLKAYTTKDALEIEVKDMIKSIRDTAKKIVESTKKKYPTCDEEALFSQIADTFVIANELFSLVKNFSERLMKEKKEKKIFSFGDIAQLAYKALIKDGTYNRESGKFEKTDYALELSEKFHEILIDEYQDVNELQDTVFRAISNSHNRFMVGDLKQSIYKFRGATPEIFSKYRDTFAPIESKDGQPRVVALQNNFRSDASVINFVNALFCNIMNYRSETVYRATDFLTFSKDTDENIPTEISIFQADGEYDYVADRILESVVEKSERSFSDFCIIARRHGDLEEAQSVLSSRGIPTNYTPSENFFKSYEIETTRSLLKAIDNPTNDISLTSLLLSPIFSFTPSEILTLRKSGGSGEIYFLIKGYCGDTELEEKCRKVIESLRLWRAKASTASIPVFLWWLYSKTQLLYFVSNLSDAKNRIESLLVFYSLAEKFERGEHKDLTKFLSYLDSFDNSKQKFKSKALDGNSVRLMTIHDSKGLEFPVCFYIASTSPLNRADERKKVKISETFGPAFAIPVGKLGGRITTYAEKANVAETRADSIDEELRLLYVALTRAKNSLIITASMEKTGIEKFSLRTQLSCISKPIFSHSIKNAHNMFEIIGMGMYENPTFKNALDSYGGENMSVEENALKINLFSVYDSPMYTNVPKLNEAKSSVNFDEDEIEFALTPMYDESMIGTPYKVSVSALREGLLDEGADATEIMPRKYPDFNSTDIENIAAFTGTAMHVFMQFCDFKACVEHGTVCEAERLAKNGFITEEQKNILNHKTLNDFFNSELFRQISASPRVERERRYTLMFPASKLYEDEKMKEKLDALGQKTLIQGVIDCYFINPDGSITLIDFKTDNVKSDDGEEILRKRHEKQMSLYKEAIEKIENKPVAHTKIYSFCLSKEIEFD